MPEKDGTDDKKTTKEVVNKKQKQMMGEEGYDHLRDQGRIRKNKKKKDATTLPVSDEVKKTRKVNKGPSALDIVKKKYKGQIMDVKKEELDLTQVAEAFGGYIIEKDEFVSFFDGSDEPDSKPKVTKGKGKDTKKPKKVIRKGPKITGDVQTPKSTIKTVERPADVQGRMDATDTKRGGYSRVDLTDKEYDDYKKAKIMGTPTKTIGKMKVTQDDSVIDPKFKKTKPVKKVVTPPEVRQAKQDFGKGDKVIGKPTGDMDAETYKVKKPKRQYYKATKKSRKATPKELERTKKLVAKADAKEKAKMYKSPETGRMTRRTKSLRDTPIGLADRRVKVAAQKTKQFAAQGAKSVATKVRAKPGSSAALGLLAVGTVADVIRGLPKIPTPPKVRGGTVGRRTAG